MHSHVSQLLLVLTCAISVNGLVPILYRDDMRRTGLFFKAGQDQKLTNHVITSYHVISMFQCAQACLGTSGCKSYNYQEAGSPLHICQLSNQSKSSAPSSDYVIQSGFSYYDAEQYVLPACIVSCANGGTCENGRCKCPEDYMGSKCETWIGLDGSSSSRPGRSCLNIKKSGKDKGDGEYWIDPARSGKPFFVKCDMTTDGGGWLVVQNSTLNTTTPSGFQEIPDYTHLIELNSWYNLLNIAVLINLRNDMGFNQMRYYCHKKSVGRTVHLMTTTNSTGLDAVRFLVESASPPATACGSFVALSDDTSILSKANCQNLGNVKDGISYLNRWGHTCCLGEHRFYKRPLFYSGSPQKSTIVFFNNRYWCDDVDDYNLQIGDRWLLFVR